MQSSQEGYLQLVILSVYSTLELVHVHVAITLVQYYSDV